MNPDRLLKALGGLARDREREEELPSRHVRLSEPELERLLGRVWSEGSTSPSASHSGSRSSPSAESSPFASVVDFVRRGRRWLAAVMVPVAVAVVWVLWPAAQSPPLPTFAATLSGGVALVRGARDDRAGAPPRAEASVVLVEGARLELVLRPATADQAGSSLRAFWRQGERLAPWGLVSIERAESGAFRVQGAVERPFGVAHGELVLVVTRPEDLAPITASVLDAPSPRWRVVRQQVTWR